MKKTIVIAAALVAVAGASAATTNFMMLPPAAPAGQFVEFGHIKKLTRAGTGYVMRFDPAWFTTGLTASVAAKEDTGSSEVPNDVYTIEEGHRLLSYKLPANARITVLTNHGNAGISSTPISAAELYRIVNGGPHRPLFEPLLSGVWIRIRNDTVKELDQQFRP